MSAVSFDSEKLADVLASPQTEPIKKDIQVEIIAAEKPVEPAFEQDSLTTRAAAFGKEMVLQGVPPILGLALLVTLWAMASKYSQGLPGPIQTWASAVQLFSEIGRASCRERV